MRNEDDDLLKPTLGDYQRVPQLYSTTGFFVSAFFGGPLGAAIYGSANSDRLGRLSRDLAPLLGIAAAGFALPWLLHQAGLLEQLSSVMGGRAARNYEIFMRAFGLLASGAIYLMHRRFFRAAKVSGSPEKAGWIPGIVALVAGIAANSTFIRAILANGMIER